MKTTEQQFSKQWMEENKDVIEYAGKMSLYGKELAKTYGDPSTPPKAIALMLLAVIQQMLPQMFEDETKEKAKQLHGNLDFFITSLKPKDIQ